MLRADRLDDGAPGPEERPWNRPELSGGVAFLVLWATGADPQREGLFRIQALRSGATSGAWERFDHYCDPFAGRRASEPNGEPGAGREGEARATKRMSQEFGVRRERLAGAPPASALWPELLAFLGERAVLVTDREELETWSAALSRARGPGETDSGAWDAGAATEPGLDALTRRALGLSEIAGLLIPGRLGADRAVLCARLLPSHVDLPRAIGPRELCAAFAALVGRFLLQPAPVLGVAVHGWTRAYRGLGESEPRAARELALALALVEHPGRWAGADGGLFARDAGLEDGRLDAALAAFPRLETALSEGVPRGARGADAPETKPLPTNTEEPAPFTAEDRRALDEIFEVYLPRHFADGGSERAAYRASQHAVARAVADGFGSGDLLLVHAPTGTGKTLAYLVPALLWARRNGVRVGVATYTRALQEQAMDREVPLALELLERALPSHAGAAAVGEPSGAPVGEPTVEGTPLSEPRVALLKGRENYLCWRALRLAEPAPGDGPLAVLAWTQTALFALTDPDADLDRLPRRAFLSLSDADAWRREMGRCVRLSRAESGCCRRRSDRDACGGERSRKRAERSHVVLTNHAFALARRELFKHVVFDECEHLHEGAHGAWSHEIPLADVRRALERAHRSGRAGALTRVAELALRGSPARAEAEVGMQACGAAASALDRLEAELFGFRRWRETEGARRSERETHSLFREYALSPRAEGLLDAHLDLVRACDAVGASLGRLAELLESVDGSGKARLRRGLDLLRSDLGELLEGVAAWIPRADTLPVFRGDTFYDADRDARGGDVLASRVLLPHEMLGRHYYPDLAGAVFLSATTWMRGGFEAAASYLGLARAAEPAESEEREPRRVRTFRAPEVFDYSRVRVFVPRDAPSYRVNKGVFLDYVARFVAHLAERTRGRMLVLFTSLDDCRRTAERAGPELRARHIAFWHQGMPGAGKEELSELFRARVDSVLFGVDTFWYGADFPGETLEYLVIVKLPYGVPDAYHHGQCAALGEGAQRERIYMPRALAKFRQGFGRLMRKESDRGCVFLLDGRVLEPRHRAFLRELPLADPLAESGDAGGALLVRGDTDRCLREALAHMGMLADVRLRGLDVSFGGGSTRAPVETRPLGSGERAVRSMPLDNVQRDEPEPGGARRAGPAASPRAAPADDISLDDLPY